MSYFLYKALHLIAMVIWFVGLIYLPKIFIYHSTTAKKTHDLNEIFMSMERKLIIVMHIGAMLTLIFGVILLVKSSVLMKMPWMHIKLTLLLLLFVYHGFCTYFVHALRRENYRYSDKFYRCFSRIPVFFLITIILLAVLKIPSI